MNRTRWLGLGFLLGAAVGLVWTQRRMEQITRHGAPGLLDWARVWEIAARYCPEGGVQPQHAAYYAALVTRGAQEVAAYTGLPVPQSAFTVRVLDRRQWLHANLDPFRAVLQPVDDLYRRTASARNPVTLFFGEPICSLLSHQVGLMLGYLGQRVLGQYDMALLGREPLQDGQLYFVEPNIRATQAELGLAGDDFPMWVALHESTHAFQFQSFPWLRSYLNGLLRAYLDELEPEVDLIGQQLSPSRLPELLERIGRGEPWMLWALTPRQRELFDRMQAFMCLIEGYGNLVMKRVGQRILPTFAWIEAQVARRRAQRTPAEKLFARLTGLELKMEQYIQGERFAEAVASRRGLAFLNRAWERPENLPTLPELERPERWIARMEAGDEGR